MRVKINYAIDLEEIPEIVTGLLEKIDNNCKEIQKDIHHCKEFVKEESMLKTIKKITDMRNDLVKIDECLHDCSIILTGYQTTILAENSRSHVLESDDMTEEDDEKYEQNKS